MTNTLPKSKKSVSMLSWAYNEEMNIEEFLHRALKLMRESVEDFEIVLIDDGSKDRTYELAAEIQKTNPELKIYKNDKNRNVGYSHKRAISLATKDFLFWQMVDWCYDIEHLHSHLQYLYKSDVVQGVRHQPKRTTNFLSGAVLSLKNLLSRKHITSRSDTVGKAWISVINYLVVRFFFRVPLSDFQNVSIYPTKWLQSITYEANSSFANPEGLIKAHWAGLNIKEVPIGFIARQKGEAKGTSFKTITNSIKDILKFWWKWVILRKRDFVHKGRVERVWETGRLTESKVTG